MEIDVGNSWMVCNLNIPELLVHAYSNPVIIIIMSFLKELSGHIFNLKQTNLCAELDNPRPTTTVHHGSNVPIAKLSNSFSCMPGHHQCQMWIELLTNSNKWLLRRWKRQLSFCASLYPLYDTYMHTRFELHVFANPCEHLLIKEIMIYREYMYVRAYSYGVYMQWVGFSCMWQHMHKWSVEVSFQVI